MALVHLLIPNRVKQKQKGKSSVAATAKPATEQLQT
jgi:hypothetical protein